jgi:type IV secretory pathway VirJ component
MLDLKASAGSVVAALGDLPVVEIAAREPGRLAAIIYSGDGGWRDLDRTVGEALADRGVRVIGVDSLRYFWQAKTPERIAADLSRILAACRAAWGDVRFIVIGYSFGAGVLPFAVNRLSPADRSRIVQVSLLGLEPRAPFEIEVRGWLQQAPSESAAPVRPELQRLDPALVQCFYGTDETESLCRDPALARSEVIRTSGGHHFDGNYVGLAERILEGARRRMALEG